MILQIEYVYQLRPESAVVLETHRIHSTAVAVDTNEKILLSSEVHLHPFSIRADTQHLVVLKAPCAAIVVQFRALFLRRHP